jgi:hypothetical protein
MSDRLSGFLAGFELNFGFLIPLIQKNGEASGGRRVQKSGR